MMERLHVSVRGCVARMSVRESEGVKEETSGTYSISARIHSFLYTLCPIISFVSTAIRQTEICQTTCEICAKTSSTKRDFLKQVFIIYILERVLLYAAKFCVAPKHVDSHYVLLVRPDKGVGLNTVNHRSKLSAR